MRAFHRLHHLYGIAFKRGSKCNSSWHLFLSLTVSWLSYILRIGIAMIVCAQRRARSIPYIADAEEKNQPAYSSAPVDTGPCTLYGDPWPRPGSFGREVWDVLIQHACWGRPGYGRGGEGRLMAVPPVRNPSYVPVEYINEALPLWIVLMLISDYVFTILFKVKVFLLSLITLDNYDEMSDDVSRGLNWTASRLGLVSLLGVNRHSIYHVTTTG